MREHEEKSLCNSAGCKSGCVWTDRMREWIPEQCRAGKSKTDGLVSVRGPVKESGEWLQTMCESFAEENPQWDITFVYGVADEATAASQVSQDPEASADVFMYANDTLTTMTDANALAKIWRKVQRRD